MPRRNRSGSHGSRSRSRSVQRERRGFSDRSHYHRRYSPRRTSTKPDFDPACQVYIAKFSRRTREVDLRSAFERFGRVISVDMKYYGNFAFIVFESVGHALDAIEEMHGRTLSNRDTDQLIVEQAGLKKSRRMRPDRRYSRSPSPSHHYRGGGSYAHHRGRESRGNDHCFNCGREGHWASNCRENNHINRYDLREGRCFNCGGKGHKRIDCPEENAHRNDRSYSSVSRSSTHSRSRGERNPTARRDRPSRRLRSVSSVSDRRRSAASHSSNGAGRPYAEYTIKPQHPRRRRPRHSRSNSSASEARRQVYSDAAQSRSSSPDPRLRAYSRRRHGPRHHESRRRSRSPKQLVCGAESDSNLRDERPVGSLHSGQKDPRERGRGVYSESAGHEDSANLKSSAEQDSLPPVQ